MGRRKREAKVVPTLFALVRPQRPLALIVSRMGNGRGKRPEFARILAISGPWLLKGAGGRGSTGGRVHVAGPAQPSGLKVDQDPPHGKDPMEKAACSFMYPLLLLHAQLYYAAAVGA